jgi:hypothetical protein
MPEEKRYRFFYHLNKLETRKQNRVVWTVHWRQQCMQAYHLDIRCKTWSREQMNRQPWAVVVGDARSVEIDIDGTAVIT